MEVKYEARSEQEQAEFWQWAESQVGKFIRQWGHPYGSRTGKITGVLPSGGFRVLWAFGWETFCWQNFLIMETENG